MQRLALLTLFFASTGLAEDDLRDDDTPSRFEARPRYSAGYHLGWSRSGYWDPPWYFPAGTEAVAGVGLIGGYLRGGFQSGDYLGLELEASGSCIFNATGYLRGAAMVVVTPTDHFSIAVGPVAGVNIDNVGGVICLFGCDPATFATFAGGTARLDLHFLSQRTAHGGRRAATVSLAADLTQTQQIYGYRSGTTLSNQGRGLFLLWGYEIY